MPFDDLTTNQRQLIITLVEEIASGRYSSEFWTAATMGGRGWAVQLFGKDDTEDKELDVEFEETDLRELSTAGYLTLISKGGDYAASLKPKAYQEYKLLKDPLDLLPTVEERIQHQQQPTLDIFISHSSRDKAVAEALIELLRNALNIPADRIRCTTVDGYRLPAGASTDEQLRREVREARVFIGLITKASIESAYVLFELGTRWGAQLHLAPLLTSSADTNFLRGPLGGLNALSCDVSAQVHQLVSDISAHLNTSASSPAAYQKYVDTLVRRAKGRQRQSRKSGAALAGREKGNAAPIADQPELSKAEQELLVAAEQAGDILLDSFDQGKLVRAGSRTFYDPADPAVTAAYIGALRSLCQRGLAEHDEGDLHVLTDAGFKVARELIRRRPSE